MIAVLEPLAQKVDRRESLDDSPLFEIIDGMSILANSVANELHIYLGHHVQVNRLGRALMETLFHLPLPVDRNRRPDVAFVSAQAIAETPTQPGSDNAWDVLPELMVEVISPSDIAEEIIERLHDYFGAGVKLVWIVYPTRRLIHVYQSLRQVRILGEEDELNGGSVIPDFRIPIRSLFSAT